MFSLAVATAVGWLLLFVVLLAVPPTSSGDGGGASRRPEVRDEPPAVVGLLARRLNKYGFTATLVDLAARGWFQVNLPGQPALLPSASTGAWVSAGPAMCTLPAELPTEQLAPYERRVAAHVALRAGIHGEVPAPALSDGFEGGEAAFLKAFCDEVTADARQRGLTRARLGGGRIALLCVLLLVPTALPVLAMNTAQRDSAFPPLAGACVLAFVFTIGFGVSRRPSTAGQTALDGWRAAVDAAPGSGGRLEAYATALGRSAGTAAMFTLSGKNVVWSRYRGSWQELPIETTSLSCRQAVGVLLVVTVGPALFIGAVIGLFMSGLAVLAELLLKLAGIGVLAAFLIPVARRLFPRFAEFDGQVVRQTFVAGDDESPDKYFIVIDDGVRATAWNLAVSAAVYPLLAPGTFVHARVNLYKRAQVTVDPVEPAAGPPRGWPTATS